MREYGLSQRDFDAAVEKEVSSCLLTTKYNF